MLLLTLPGTPILYAGDEIGMGDVAVPPEHARDPFERRVPGYGLNRDPERSPMRWDARANAGFTTGEPWLPLADDVDGCNVEAQRKDERSLLALYRRLLELRRHEPALRAGSYEPLDGSREVLAYCRCLDGRRICIALNFADAEEKVALQAQVRSGSRPTATGLTSASTGTRACDRTRESFLRLAAEVHLGITSAPKALRAKAPDGLGVP
jgi:alpha-glucosidase